MYATKEQDHEKRKDQEGSYSPYNHIYNWLLSNYESDHKFTEADKALMLDEYVNYCAKGGSDMHHAKEDIEKAINNFKANDGKRGDTANNLGKRQENSFNTIKQSLSDLRW